MKYPQEIPTGKNFRRTKYPQEIILELQNTHKKILESLDIPANKNFGPPIYAQKNILDSQNTLRKTFCN